MTKSLFPTSPDGTDWGIFGDTPREQWEGMEMEAQLEDIERTLTKLRVMRAGVRALIGGS